MTTDDGTPDPALAAWFERVWAEREDEVYRRLFGDLGQGVHGARPEHFARFGKGVPHPGWLHHGVFACPPHGARAHWLYATSGLSNPWNLAAPGEDPTGWSGLGFELCLCTPAVVDWAPAVLHHLMAWQLLVATGAVQGRPLRRGQRVPLGGAIDGRPADAADPAALTWALVEAPADFEAGFRLPSGAVDWLLLVGVTAAEVDFARAHEQPALVALLDGAGHWPVTRPGRPPVA